MPEGSTCTACIGASAATIAIFPLAPDGDTRKVGIALPDGTMISAKSCRTSGRGRRSGAGRG